MVNRARKKFPAATLAMDDEKGVIEAIVSVTGNKDRGGERVMPGFFKKSLEKKLPRMVWCHDWNMPIGTTLAAEEWHAGDGRLPERIRPYGGYYVKGKLDLETLPGDYAYKCISKRAIDEFSIGFMVEQEAWNAGLKTKDLIEGEWFEWSPVLVGMNPETALLSIKSFDAQVKGQYLGDYIESSMAMGACGRAVDTLYYLIADCIYDLDMPMAERLQRIAGGCDEHRDLVLRVVEAILSGSADETPEMAVKYIQQTFLNPQEYDDRLALPRTGLALAQHSELALTALSGLIKRIQAVAEWKAANRSTKEGRVLSEDNRQLIKGCAEQMAACAGALMELYDATDRNKEEKQIKEARRLYAEFLYLDAQLSAGGVL